MDGGGGGGGALKASVAEVLKPFEGAPLGPETLRKLLAELGGPALSEEQLGEILRAVGQKGGGQASLADLVGWVFADAAPAGAAPGPEPAAEPSAEGEEASEPQLSLDILGAVREGKATGADALVQASLAGRLERLVRAYPYINPEAKTVFPHPQQYWVRCARNSLEARKFEQAQEHMRRVSAGVQREAQQIEEIKGPW